MTLIPQTTHPIPGLEHTAGRTYTGKPSRALRRRMRTPERISISQWAQAYRRVTEIDSSPGPWRNELVPHLIKIMDTISLPHVREVWICAPERSGKTQVLINTACWAVDQGSRSGNIFWLMPTEADARKALGERIIPVMRARDDHGRPGRIAQYLSDYADDTTRGMIRFSHGIRLFPAWSNSPSSMASYFGRVNIADECDKFAERTSEGSDPITLFRKRARDDRGRSKYVYASTPAGRYIHKGTNEAEQLWQYHLRCPECDGIVLPNHEHLSIPDDAKSTDLNIKAVQLACPGCGALWDEQQRAQGYRSGRWVASHGDQLARPESVGYHMSAFVLPMVPLAEIAGAYLRAKDGDLSAKIAWANGYEAIDYVTETIGTRDEEHLLRYRGDFPRNTVPLDTAMLGLLVDTQQDSFYYELWAYGYAPDISMRMIRHGQLETFDDIDYLIEQESFVDADGKEFRIVTGLIDSGGTRRQWQKHSRTVEVYEYCSRQRKMQPLKGMANRTGTLISYQGVSVFPNTNKKIPGGLRRADIKVDLFKDDLERRLQIEPDDRGALLFHDEVDEAFFKHYTSEIKDDNGDWTHDRKRGRNDYWDCTVYALALREKLKTKIPRKPDAPAPEAESQHRAPRRKNFATGWK